MPALIEDDSIALFTAYHIFSETELRARYEILLENYSKLIHIESLTLQDMVKKDFTTGLLSYMSDVTAEALQKQEFSDTISVSYEKEILETLSSSSEAINAEDTASAESEADEQKRAVKYHETILADMEDVRKAVDTAEAIIPQEYLTYPTYDQLLFSLR